MFKRIFILLILSLLPACSSDDIDALTSTFDEPSRKTIDTSIMGVNAFANDQRFGSIAGQYNEVRNVLRLRYVRVLFAWNDQVQSNPGSPPNFSFYDSIASSLPGGIEALVVITGIPSWMGNSSNWIGGNPRASFVEYWVKKVVQRYRGNPRIVGWQIWNEPNMATDPDNSILEILDNPENYVEMLGRAHSAAKDLAPGKLIISGATTSINQNFPDSMNYNKSMRDAGAQEFMDIWGIHVYGRQFEKFLQDNGIGSFLRGLSRPVWVTESGRQGVSNQLAYVEQMWPFLKEEIPNIERFYYYQFAEPTGPDVTFGLRNLDSSYPVSDLYVYLRDRQ
jgi:hypothetical protein